MENKTRKRATNAEMIDRLEKQNANYELKIARNKEKINKLRQSIKPAELIEKINKAGLTIEEVMKMIGIKKESSFIAIPDGVTFSKKEIPQDKEIIKDMDTSDENCPYVFGHTVAAPSISSIFHEDEEAFWSIVTPRLFDAKEMIEQNKIYFDKKDYHFMGEKLAEAFISYYGYIGEKKEQEKWKQALQKHQLSAMFDIKIMRASKNPY